MYLGVVAPAGTLQPFDDVVAVEPLHAVHNTDRVGKGHDGASRPRARAPHADHGAADARKVGDVLKSERRRGTRHGTSPQVQWFSQSIRSLGHYATAIDDNPAYRLACLMIITAWASLGPTGLLSDSSRERRETDDG